MPDPIVEEKRARIAAAVREGRAKGGRNVYGPQYYHANEMSNDEVMQFRLPGKDINLPVERKAAVLRGMKDK